MKKRDTLLVKAIKRYWWIIIIISFLSKYTDMLVINITSWLHFPNGVKTFLMILGDVLLFVLLSILIPYLDYKLFNFSIKDPNDRHFEN